MKIVTEEFLELGVDNSGAINAQQLTLLGLKESDSENFVALSLGKKLSDARAELFVLLANVKVKTARNSIIENYKALQKFRKSGSGEETQVVIYCDGACNPNPGKAGSGVAIYRGSELEELWYGLYDPMGTNNTAELKALYESLLIAKEKIEQGERAEIKCDSKYSIECIQRWAIGWEKKGWTKKGGEIKNLEIIKKAYYLYNRIKAEVKLSHIKAHAGFEGNELADRMSMYAIEQKESDFVHYSDPIDVAKILKMRAG